MSGERLTILTNGGGAGVLAADSLADEGGVLAELSPETKEALDAVLPPTWSKGNPVDIIGDAGPDRYAHALEAVFADETSDAILVMNCPTALASSEEAAGVVIAATAKRKEAHGAPKAVLTNWLGDGSAAAQPGAVLRRRHSHVRDARRRDQRVHATRALPARAGRADADAAVAAGRHAFR